MVEGDYNIDDDVIKRLVNTNTGISMKEYIGKIYGNFVGIIDESLPAYEFIDTTTGEIYEISFLVKFLFAKKDNVRLN